MQNKLCDSGDCKVVRVGDSFAHTVEGRDTVPGRQITAANDQAWTLESQVHRARNECRVKPGGSIRVVSSQPREEVIERVPNIVFRAEVPANDGRGSRWTSTVPRVDKHSDSDGLRAKLQDVSWLPSCNRAPGLRCAVQEVQHCNWNRGRRVGRNLRSIPGPHVHFFDSDCYCGGLGAGTGRVWPHTQCSIRWARAVLCDPVPEAIIRFRV